MSRKNCRLLSLITSCIIPFSMVTIGGCNSDQLRRINGSVSSSFRDLNIEVNDSVYVKNTKLFIDIEYISNYYLMDETNELINSFVFSNLGTFLNDYSLVIVKTRFDGLSDEKVSLYETEAVRRMQNRFDSKKLFKDAFCYLIKNSNSNEIIGFNEIIKDFQVYLPGENLFEGNFWDLVENYTLNYQDSTSEACISVEMLYEVAKYPKLKLRPEIIGDFMELCENSNQTRNS